MDYNLQVPEIHCLMVCVELYAGSCGHIKNHFIKQLDKMWNFSDKTVIQALAKFYALFPGVGGGGKNKVLHTEAWTTQFQKILDEFDICLHKLYGEFSAVDSNNENLLVEEEEPARTLSLQNRMSFLSSTLCEMLRIDYPFTVNIPISSLLDLICRICQVNRKTLSHKNTNEMVALSSVISIIHKDAMTLLQSLISRCKGHLVIYNNIVNKLFLQTLAWTTDKIDSSSELKDYSQLRCTTYNVLIHWLEINKSMTGIHRSIKQILPHIFEDIQPKTEETKLFSKPLQSIYLKKKKSNKLLQTMGKSKMDISTAFYKKDNPFANCKICHLALKVIKILLMVASTSIPSSVHVEIQDFLLKLIPKIQQKDHLCPVAYNNEECRCEIYSILKLCITAPISKSLLFCQNAKTCFIQGQLDSSLKVKSVCLEALVTCAGLECHVTINNIVNEAIQPEAEKQDGALTLADEKISELSSFLNLSKEIPKSSTPITDYKDSKRKCYEESAEDSPAKKKNVRNIDNIPETINRMSTIENPSSEQTKEEFASDLLSDTSSITDRTKASVTESCESLLNPELTSSQEFLSMDPLMSFSTPMQAQESTNEKQNENNSEDEPELEEMLNSFVDTNPDKD